MKREAGQGRDEEGGRAGMKREGGQGRDEERGRQGRDEKGGRHGTMLPTVHLGRAEQVQEREQE